MARSMLPRRFAFGVTTPGFGHPFNRRGSWSPFGFFHRYELPGSRVTTNIKGFSFFGHIRSLFR
jgi:hypothetical protein